MIPLIPPCPPGKPFYALAIIAHRYERSGLHRGEDAIILANDEDKSPSHRRRSQFLTFPVRVAAFGDDPGQSFRARAEYDWQPIGQQLEIPWHNVSRVPEVGEIGLMKGLFVLRVGMRASINIDRECRELGIRVIPMGCFRCIKPYYSLAKPETLGRNEDREYSYMYSAEHYGLARVIRLIWPSSNIPAFSRP